MHARNATVKKVDKTLKALSSASLSVTPTRTHLKPEAASPISPAGLRSDNSDDDDSDGWETDLECDEVRVTMCLSGKGKQMRGINFLCVILFLPCLQSISFRQGLWHVHCTMLFASPVVRVTGLLSEGIWLSF